MKIDVDQFRVRPPGKERKLDLSDWPTLVDPVYHSKSHYDKLLAEHVERMREHQTLLYASNEQAILLIFQAMDAAGKDGAIEHVMSGVNPQGCQVHSFKHPSADELEHDFLWRTTVKLPARGQIGIFNRSYYEEVLIVRVHPELLRAEDVPGSKHGLRAVWRGRYQSIVDFERHLDLNGTRILKFFLHLSKDEQRKRFLDRIDDPAKNWKISPDDIAERRYWSEYRDAYGACIGATSTREAPWYVIPADDKLNARLLISQAVTDLLAGLKLAYPKVDAKRRDELKAIRAELA
jgi:PPK2 family polyphosphate:nucleotide phosphotransferase